MHHDGRRAFESEKRQYGLGRHVHCGRVNRLEHDLLEGTEGRQTDPPHRQVRRVFPLEVLATLLGDELASEMAARSRLWVLRLLGGSGFLSFSHYDTKSKS